MANAWHLTRAAGGADALQRAGGAHGFMRWPGILFTDSGGYQVFSLKDTTDIGDEGVRFETDEELLTPEHVVHMQKVLGSDVMMVLDDCAPFPCPPERAAVAVERTTQWASRSVRAHRETAPRYGYGQSLWGIVQGGADPDLRRRSIDEIASFAFDGYGIGGLSIGMPRETVRAMTALVCDGLPADKPRHLLGVGLPGQILDGIEDGADTFDCVLPIRKAQRGIVYTTFGEVALKKPIERRSPTSRADDPVDPRCACPTCARYSREALQLLFRVDKTEAARAAAVHNLCFYHALVANARQAIGDDRFLEFRRECLANFGNEGAD
jgi:queuine tRNA-ribosyltransferase